MRTFSIVIAMFFPIFLFGQKTDDLKTHFELTHFKETPNYSQTIEYCELLVEASKMINMINIGESPQGREIPILILDKNGSKSPTAIRNAGRAIVFIQACVHAGEPDGKDAGFLLLRNIIDNDKYLAYLDYISIVFMPIFNVDGHERWSAFNRINQNGPKEMGWRTTSANYNLNRDYLKAESQEMKLWIEMYNEWNPDFLIDCHTTDGADYQYSITYSLETGGNLDEKLTNWVNTKYINKLDTILENKGYPIFPYVIFRNWHDPRSGLVSYASPLKLLNGYAAARNRICLLIETHMLKSYENRVFATYEMLLASLKIIAQNSDELIELNDLADKKSAKINNSEPFVLKYSATNDSTMVTFKGVHYDIKQSELTNSPWFIYDSTKKEDFIVPYFNKLKAINTTTLPVAYAIPPEINFIESNLKLHDIDYFVLKNDISVKCQVTHFKDVKLSATSSEGKQPLESFDMQAFQESIDLYQGTIIVPVNQVNSKLIAHLFEPKSPDSYLQWGYFNIIFEQKEYAESYVMEKMMRDMMSIDTDLKKEFEQKIASDSIFANNSRIIYNWFYSKTPYWDKKLNVYPILRITDEATLEQLETSKGN